MGRTSLCERVLAVPPGAVLQRKSFHSTDSHAEPAFSCLGCQKHHPNHLTPNPLTVIEDTAFLVPVPANPQASWELREAENHCSVHEGAAGDGSHGVGCRGTRDNSSTAAERRLIPFLHKFQSVTPCCSRPLAQEKQTVQWQGYTVCIWEWVVEMISNDFETNFCCSPSGTH